MSPCASLDLPQSYLEPILVRYATTGGATVMFNTCFADLEQDDQGCLTTITNIIFGHNLKVRSKYVFGCDGARSPIASKINLAYNVQPSGGVAYNILFNADLSDIMRHQTGHLHWIMQPDAELEHGIAPVLRMVKVCSCRSFLSPVQILTILAAMASVDAGGIPETRDGYQGFRVHARGIIAGERSASSSHRRRQDSVRGGGHLQLEDQRDGSRVLFQTERVSNPLKQLSSRLLISRSFCLGDAVHRHPPVFGLGSNTCLQDSYNLAWKVAMVVKGEASPALLETFNEERQPVGQDLVKWSNELLRNHATVWGAIGVGHPISTFRLRLTIFPRLE